MTATVVRRRSNVASWAAPSMPTANPDTTARPGRDKGGGDPRAASARPGSDGRRVPDDRDRARRIEGARRRPARTAASGGRSMAARRLGYVASATVTTDRPETGGSASAFGRPGSRPRRSRRPGQARWVGGAPGPRRCGSRAASTVSSGRRAARSRREGSRGRSGTAPAAPRTRPDPSPSMPARIGPGVTLRVRGVGRDRCRQPRTVRAAVRKLHAEHGQTALAPAAPVIRRAIPGGFVEMLVR